MNQLEIFRNREFGEIRTVMVDGEPWFVAKDIAEILQYTNTPKALHDAGVDSKYIAAEVVRIYSDSGYPVNAPLISDTPKLWDCTTIAKELGIFSEAGRPHDKAVSAIIQKLDLFTDEIVRTAYSRNGHDGVTMQYKESVFQKVKEWLQENGYPTVIELELANGNVNKCRVVYGEVA